MPPLDVDGLQAMSIGLALFGVAAVLCGIFFERLQAAGDGWWLGVCIAGFGLGLCGLAYCGNRRRRRRT